MDNKTVQYKRTLRGSVGAGVSALFNGNGRRYYILEHKDASKYHKAGESQKIIIDQVELGRDSNCQVRFDETFPTVSRRHAAIIKDGDRWKLVQLSKTNSTFLNGRPIETEWFLENGDEIQLSVGGPRMGFIVPAGKQSLVSSIKMTERLELFRKQALRPYKTAIAVLFAMIIILSCGGGYKIYDQHVINQALIAKQDSIAADNDTLKCRIVATSTELTKSQTIISDLTKQIKNLRRNINPKPSPVVGKLDDLSENVYFIQLMGYQITDPNGKTGIVEVGDTFLEEKVKGISGTGFLLNDGTFVTARHVVEPWYYGSDDLSVKLNLYSSNGFKIDALLYAVSASGNHFELKTSVFKCNRSHDRIESLGEYKIRDVSSDYTDYASTSVGLKGTLVYDSQLSTNLKAGEKLIILGYPLGLGSSSSGVKPSYSSAEVARDGLADGGYILTTSTGFEHGNSGGPVFVERNGKKVVIGIVSAGAGRSTGFVVPIAVVK